MPPQTIDVQWNGDEHIRRMTEATRDAIDETAILCVQRAVSTVHVVTAVLQGGIDFKPAQIEPGGKEVVGEWGVYDVDYAIWEELLHPYVRPAADAYYPGIKGRIARRLT